MVKLILGRLREWLVECQAPTLGFVSERWVQQHHLVSRVEYHGPCWHWPVRR